MASSSQSLRVVRFGVFEMDLKARQLRKCGVRLKIHDQPFQILVTLAQRPGEVVTREELRQTLWPGDTFVDFDHSINTAVNKLRETLGDSAETPRFIETIARRGYRFVAPVETVTLAPSTTGGSTDAAPIERPYQRPRIRTLVLLLATLLATTAATLFLRNQTAEPPLVAVPLTTYPGLESSPSFSPDGQQVTFTWCQEGPSRNCHIYVKQIGVESPFRLTNGPAEDFDSVWSPDGGTIAFFRRVAPAKWALMVIPQRGGPERELAAFDWSETQKAVMPGMDWTPDSKWIVCPDLTDQHNYALFLIPVEAGEKQRLTHPPATMDGDMTPSFSPDGRNLAFSRRIFATDEADLYILHMGLGYRPSGEPAKAAVDNLYNYGSAWTADGREIVFASSGTPSNFGLWRVSARKPSAPARLAFALDHASQPAISRRGSRLAYVVEKFDSNIWRVSVAASAGKPARPALLISSTQPELYAAYSMDGKRIAFISKRSGAWEIWVSEADGTNPIQLTSFAGSTPYGPRWSPDGQTIAFSLDTQRKSEIYAISANGGKPRLLITDEGQWPYWSKKGDHIYFAAIHDGRLEISKRSLSGGDAVEITRRGGDHPEESPDGKMIYYSKGWPHSLSVWRVPVDGGEEVKVIDPVHVLGQWTVGRHGIYFFSPPDKHGSSDIRLYEFATSKIKTLLTVKRDISYSIAASPDDQTIIYTQRDEEGSDLMLVEHFR